MPGYVTYEPNWKSTKAKRYMDVGYDSNTKLLISCGETIHDIYSLVVMYRLDGKLII